MAVLLINKVISTWGVVNDRLQYFDFLNVLRHQWPPPPPQLLNLVFNYFYLKEEVIYYWQNAAYKSETLLGRCKLFGKYIFNLMAIFQW